MMSAMRRSQIQGARPVGYRQNNTGIGPIAVCRSSGSNLLISNYNSMSGCQLYPQIRASSLRDSGKAGSSFLRDRPQDTKLLILASSVVRFSPRLSAAPCGPLWIQPACPNVSKIKVRSESSEVIDKCKVRVRCRLGIMRSVCFL